MFPPTIILISPSNALGLSSDRQLGLGSLGGFSPPLTNRCNFPILKEGFDLLLEVIVFKSIALMVLVEATVFVSGSFV